MINKTLYLCENCGKEFTDASDCSRHENTCANKIKLYSGNVQNTIDKIKKEYGSIVKSIEFTIEDTGFEVEESYVESYTVVASLILSNNNQTSITNLDYHNEDTCYCQIREEIQNLIPVKYEGIIAWKYEECGWRVDYIGDVKISDIVDRLNGRVVRLEVIE
jgi:uncharacterized C2H2 Zn-finger protein